MKKLSGTLYQTHSSFGTSGRFLEEPRESFFESSAYDFFEWPALPETSSVNFRPLAVKSAPNDSGGGQAETTEAAEAAETDDPVSLYTSNADFPIHLTGEVVVVDDVGTINPQTAISGPLIGVEDFRADARFAGVDGSGYTVAVLDTGIDLDDPFFGPDLNGDGISDRIVYQYDFADGDSNAGDYDGHGSNVASIAASSDGTYTGMAPGADIAALKVFTDADTGHFGYVEEALQWVIANAEAYNIVSVNMSLGDFGNYDAPVQLYGIADELAALAAMDVIVVSASGNDFYPFNSIQGVSYPSADPNSLSVGAVYSGDSGNWEYLSGAKAYSTTADQIAPFSQRDDELSDIFAPGASIIGAGAGEELVEIHGTSQAAPHIAGIIALTQELAVREVGRKLTFDEIQALLEGSGDTIIDGDDEDDNVNNTGLAFQRVNVLALGEAILDLAQPVTQPLRDPTYFQVSALDKTAAEGDGGSTGYSFVITRSGDLSEADSIDYSVAGSGAAPAGAADFLGGNFPSGSVTFGVGETSKIVTIEVAGDSTVEPNESFALTIANVPSNGQVVIPSDEATVENDDAPSSGPVVLLQASFDETGDTEGFVYRDDLFGGNNQDYARGEWASDALTVTLGGIDNVVTADMSGGWETTIVLDAEMEVSLSFLYRLTMEQQYEDYEFGQVLVSIDGGAPIMVAELVGNGNGGPDETTGNQTFKTVLGTLGAGSHTLAIGLYNNQKTWRDESSYLTIDDVLVTGTPAEAPPATPAPDTFFAIAVDDAVQAEGDAGTTAYTFTVTRSGDTTGIDSVDWNVTGSHIDGSDFLAGFIPGGGLTFAAGETTKTLTVHVTGDNDVETDEGFGVVLANPTAGAAITTAGAVGTILDDDAVATPETSYDIAALSAQKVEGDDGLTDFTFTVTRSGDVSKAGLVSYEVTAGETDAGDFAYGILPHGALFFAAGETSKTITVQAAGDEELEGHETFDVNLFNALGGADITTGSANGTISDDDTPGPSTVAITALDAVKAEGDAGLTEFTFEVARSGSTAWTASVDFAVDHDTTNQLDFLNGTNGRLYFYPGETSKIITVGVKGDWAIEPDETFSVTLYSPSAGLEITTASADGVIINDEVTPTTFIDIAALDAAKAEGDSGATAFTFTVTRSGDVSASGSVDYSVSSATPNPAQWNDFFGGTPSGTIEFQAGEASKTLTVEIQGDTYNEADEHFVVNLGNASGNTSIITNRAQGEILNDDFYETSLVSIAREVGPLPELDSHTSSHSFLVTRTGDISTTITLDYAVTGDDVDGADFVGGVLPSGTITFVPQQTTAGILINVNGDRDFESDEPFTVTLSNPSSGAEIVVAGAESTILNDDQEPGTTFYEISAVNAVQAEGDSGDTLYNFVVMRSGDLSFSSVIKYSLSGAGASPATGDDFTTGLIDSGAVAFAANQASKAITVRVSGDTDFELDEDFVVTIFDATAEGVVLTGSATGTIVNDDSAPATTFLSITANDQTKAEGDDGSTAFTFTVTRAGDASQASSVDYSVTSSTANRVDFAGFEMPSDTVEFAAGETSKAVTIDVRGDYTFESNETFTVWLSNPSDGQEITTGNANSTIINDDEDVPATSFLWIRATDTTHEEGDSDTTTFTFGIERRGDIHPEGSVDYYVSARSADASDFPGGVLPSGRIFFDEGETFKTFTVEIAGDTDFEFNEQFGVTLTNPSTGLDVALDTALGTVFNDDAPPPGESAVLLSADFNPGSGHMYIFNYFDGALGISGNSNYVHGNYTDDDLRIWMGGVDDNEVNGASGGWKSEFYVPESMEVTLTFDYRVTHSGAFESDEFTQVLFNIDGGSVQLAAQVDGDSGSSTDVSTGPTTYQAGLGMLEEGYHTLVLGGYLNHKDAIDEESEIFFDNVLVTGDFSEPIETFVAIAAEDAVKAEGDAGTTAYTFTVTRTGDASGAGSVDWVVSGTGIDTADFASGTLPSGTVTFLAGETSKTVTIEVSGDTGFEADESFTVTLSNASAGSQITTPSAEGTILNDDAAPPSTFYELVTGTAKYEGDTGTTDFTFTVDRSGDVSGTGSLDFTVTSSEADGNDFFGGTLPSGTIAFAAGQTRQTISIEVAGDTDFEPDEIFTITLSNPSAGGEITVATAGGQILNDDPDPATSFLDIRSENAAKDEGDSGTTDFTFTVTRSGNTSGTSSVDWTTSGGADAADFGGSLPGGTVNFAAGENSKTITVEVAGDTDYEDNEFFSVLLSNPSAGAEITSASAWGTIINDDPTPPATFFAIAAEDAVKDEGDTATTDFTFTVTRAGDTTGAGSVDWTVSGADVDAADFGGTLPSGTINFSSGETSRTVSISVKGEIDIEEDEVFTVTLSNASAGSEITTATAEGTILNDDFPVTHGYFSIGALDAVKTEGDAGTTAFTFTVVRSGGLGYTDTVDYAVTGAVDGADFLGGTLPSGTITFDPDDFSKTLTLEVAGDLDFEADETFTVTLFNPSELTVITTPSAEGTILNDDVASPVTFLAIAAEDAVKGEGDTGTTSFTFTATRSGDTSGVGTVDWAVSGGAVDGADFVDGVLPSGTVSFAAGETSKTITVEAGGDSVLEDDEDFTVTLSNPSEGYKITTPSAEGTILNDDAAIPLPSYFYLSAVDAVKAEGDTSTTTFLFSVTRSGAIEQFGSIDYSVSGITADQLDFAGGVLPTGTLNFAVGETIKSFSIEVAGDQLFEGNETFSVTLSNPPEGGVINQGSVTGAILNDDPAPPETFFEIAADNAVLEESDAGSIAHTFTITRSGDTTGAGTVDWAVSGGDVDSTDFVGGVLPSGSVSFAAGETSKTISVEVSGDTDFEADEDFTITLSNPSAGSEITTPTADGTILNNDPMPPTNFFAIAAEEAAKGEGDSDSTAFTFIVTRSGDTSGPASVNYSMTHSIINGGADGDDFIGGALPSGTVSFAAGETSKTLTIEVAGDTEIEDDEGFTVTLWGTSPGSAIDVASADGMILNDDQPPLEPVTVIDESFDGGAGGFAYQDGSFGGGASQTYADGTWESGALTIDLGGLDNTTASDISGGWTTSFTLGAESEISLSFLYELTQSEQYEEDEYSQVLVSIDGGPAILVDSLTGNGNGGGPLSSGPQTFSAVLGVLAAGEHSLTLGAYNSKKTWSDEFTGLTIDDVTAVATPTAPPPPVDTSYAIAATDAVLSEGDAGTTVFTFTVTRSGDLIENGSVDYTVVGNGGFPADGDDFLGGLLPSGTVTFDTAGESEATIIIEVAGDSDFEGDESFTVILSNPAAGGEITGGSAGGTILNDDAEPAGPVTLVSADFTGSGDTGGFVYSDGVFGGADPQPDAAGSWDNAALSLDLGGGGNTLVSDMSGAWEIDFILAADMDVSLSFSYELLISTQYEADEYSQVLLSLDGGAPITVDELFGDGNGGPDQTTGLQDFVLDLGLLEAGTHSLAIGGYNSKKTWSDEFTEITVDDVLVTGTVPAGGAGANPNPLGLLAGGGAEAQPLSLSETELLANAGI